MQYSVTALLLLTVCSCTWNTQPPEQQNTLAPFKNEDENTGFFSSAYKTFRDTERGIYGMLYGMRDGIDSFIYDTQKDYYQDYQK